MFHYAARAASGSVLFHTWQEGVRLYEILGRNVTNPVALCIMPDHVHLQTPTDDRRSFAVGLAAFARARNAARGETGPVFEPTEPPVQLATRDKIRRSERYIHLNPCRAALADDPLAWPLSTYRDAVGLSVTPFRAPAPDPHRLHAYTSGDPTVDIRGTLLPVAPLGVATLTQIAEACCALYRAPIAALHRRGPTRALFLRAARVLTDATTTEIADRARMSRRAVQDVEALLDDRVRQVARVVGDPRFASLPAGDLRTLYAWRRWAHLR
ncbi:MAG: hypothetical protein H6737_31605 [Alphaproteobacteria bacterium]|nr:hypothetical protein [Alphaproteobacteria bacterium]